jgi:hypothetical protein
MGGFKDIATARKLADLATQPHAGDPGPAAAKPPKSWRDVINVHPAADKFPMMTEAELRELGEDIKANGQQAAITMFESDKGERWLLDGRNRLDAMELVGLEVIGEISAGEHWLSVFVEWRGHGPRDDPYDIAISLNAHRRHLTPEKKRELIAERVIAAAKANPTASINLIAKEAGTTQPTASKIIREAEKMGDVQSLSTRTDTLGRQQPSTKPKATAPLPKPEVWSEQTATVTAPAAPPVDDLLTPEQVRRVNVAARGVRAAILKGLRELPSGDEKTMFLQAVRRGLKDIEDHDAPAPIAAPVELAAKPEAERYTPPKPISELTAAQVADADRAHAAYIASLPVKGPEWAECNQPGQNCDNPGCAKEGRCLRPVLH